MSNIDKQELREAAERAESDSWGYDRDEFNEALTPTTVLALLDELDAKDNRINRLEAIVAVAEQRNALMREWKRALKVPCDLVDDQVPVVIHGMVIRLGRLKETEAKLEAAEKRIAELPGQKRLIGWRMADYTDETADPALAKNWATAVDVLPIFEGDVNTKLSAAAAGKGE
ncbi:ead/Ea22-like family protein [Enterobacter kobei]|uniref:ead/Ea22-like family protein n=1 Tax=Enterobacter kobei TaxID=208224 RepID=UPI003967AEDE